MGGGDSVAHRPQPTALTVLQVLVSISCAITIILAALLGSAGLALLGIALVLVAVFDLVLVFRLLRWPWARRVLLVMVSVDCGFRIILLLGGNPAQIGGLVWDGVLLYCLQTLSLQEPTRVGAARSQSSLLTIENIDVFYGAVQALRGISMRVEEGEVVALIGSNGAGKTTTLRSISGLVRPRTGTITFDGQDIHELGAEKIAQLGIGHTPEGRRLFSRMTVAENLDMGAYGRRDRPQMREDLDKVLTLFPVLKERGRQLAGSLSGGEQQMVAIGRALMGKPRLLLLDEPSLGLAPIIVERIFEVIKDINSRGTTVLLIEQNALLALHTAKRGYVLETGSIATDGPSAELLSSPDVQRAYLGG